MTFEESYKQYIIEELDLKEWLFNKMMDDATIHTYDGDSTWLDDGDSDTRIEELSDKIYEEFLDKETNIFEGDDYTRLMNITLLGTGYISCMIYNDIYDECWDKVLDVLDSPDEAIRDAIELEKERRG